ncbi:uracil DNA glycosylase [Tilletia horrida]|nr:uracil DNA glycosylase [Tilletia horrida]
MSLIGHLSRRASLNAAAIAAAAASAASRPFLPSSAMTPAPSIASSRPKRAASSSPSKALATSTVAVSKKAKLNNGDAAAAPAPTEEKKKTNEDEDDLLLLEDDALDSELLMEVAEQAEREAAQKLSKASGRTSAGAAAPAAQKKGAAPAGARSASRAPAPAARNSGGSGGSSSAVTILHKDSDDEVHTMEEEWRTRLAGELKKEYYLKLKQFIATERKAGKIIYPPTHLVHNWSRLTPLRTVKVVVVGQDPYHGAGQACGHSFSVPKGVAVPASLRNIYQELRNEYPDFVPPKHGCLDEWAKQGVLLLNACLTVYAGQAASHSGKGWETFTRVVLKMVADEAARGGGGEGVAGASAGAGKVVNKSAANPFGWATVGTSKSIAASGGKVPAASSSSPPEKDAQLADTATAAAERCKGVVFLVWGQPASKTLAAAGVSEKSPNVLILRSPHPSPLSAHRGFLGNGHFKKANDWLERMYGPGGGIDWARL